MKTIPETWLRVAAQATEPRFKSAGDDGRGLKVGERNKIGGQPDWLQEAEVPSCQNCKKPMAFYGQLDSLSDGVCLADCGIIYVFVCFGCYSTSSVLQC